MHRVFMSFLVAACLMPGALVFAQNGNNGGMHAKQSLRALRIDEEIPLDGMSGRVWQQAPVALGFTQKDPNQGQPSTEKTDVRVLYTSKMLYIGIICYDSEPHGILATERRRDNKLDHDDIVTVVLDTFHDHRNAFMFRTNPFGTRYDALITDEGNNINENWDEQWEVSSKITEAGWTAEFAIPFKALRVPDSSDGKPLTFGFDVERVIRRKNESSYWNSFDRSFKLENMSQSGHLTGISEIETGFRLRIKPYGLMGFTQEVRPVTAPAPTPGAPVDFTSKFHDASNGGIEVLKYRITPSLTFDATWRTDFAQTAVDDQVVNLDRFPLFFPEKREFFQEGAGIFEFGTTRGEGQTPLLKLLNTRQIGLSPRRQPIPIVAGGRITGKVAGLTVGLLNVQTEAFEEEGIPASNYGLIRVKRDVLARSNIGAFLLNRESAGTKDHNRVWGGDATFVFYRYLNIGGVWAKSEAPGLTKDSVTHSGGVNWISDQLFTGINWLYVDRNFRDDLGFVPRRDQRNFTPRLEWLPRPKDSFIRQFRISGRWEYIMNQNYELDTRTNHYAFEARFQNGSSLGFTPHTRLERLREPFAIRPGVVRIPTGSYSWWYPRITYISNPSKRFSGSIRWTEDLGFYGGDLKNWLFEPRYRISGNTSVEVSYEWNKAKFPARMCVAPGVAECGFTNHVVNSRFIYNFSNQLLTSTTVQYNSQDSFIGLNMRLNYIFRQNDNFYLIYNEGRRIDGILDGQKDRTVQAKITYSFDF